MRSISRGIAGCYLGLICATALCNEAYHFVKEIPIGGEGGWDILTIDSAASRLYLSHATKVVVVDLNTNSVTGEIADTPGVHAFVAVPEVHRGFSSNGKESKSSVVDLTTLKTTSKIDTGSNPDAVVYEPRHGEVYVFNHSGNSVTVINAKAAAVSATIPLGGNPEFAVVDETAGRVYCNIEDKSEVAVIDANKHEVVGELVAFAGRRTKWNRFGCDASSFVRGLPQQNVGDARYRNRKGGGQCPDWLRRRRLLPLMTQHSSRSRLVETARRQSQKNKHQIN